MKNLFLGKKSTAVSEESVAVANEMLSKALKENNFKLAKEALRKGADPNYRYSKVVIEASDTYEARVGLCSSLDDYMREVLVYSRPLDIARDWKLKLLIRLYGGKTQAMFKKKSTS